MYHEGESEKVHNNNNNNTYKIEGTNLDKIILSYRALIKSTEL